jgi:hypothetical protein
MDEFRRCIACGTDLVGSFKPKVMLNQALPEEDPEQEALKVTARSWICPGCGLVHWYAEDQDLDKLLDIVLPEHGEGPKPDSSYERRSQMLRMLRRVRRM